jgi:hypothetical protein
MEKRRSQHILAWNRQAAKDIFWPHAPVFGPENDTFKWCLVSQITCISCDLYWSILSLSTGYSKRVRPTARWVISFCSKSIRRCSSLCNLPFQITVYLGKRDFVDHISHVDPIGELTWHYALVTSETAMLLFWKVHCPQTKNSHAPGMGQGLPLEISKCGVSSSRRSNWLRRLRLTKELFALSLLSLISQRAVRARLQKAQWVRIQVGLANSLYVLLAAPSLLWFATRHDKCSAFFAPHCHMAQFSHPLISLNYIAQLIPFDNLNLRL